MISRISFAEEIFNSNTFYDSNYSRNITNANAHYEVALYNSEEPPSWVSGYNLETKKGLPLKSRFSGKNSLGVTVGLGSGTGLGYRRYIDNKFSLRLSGLIIYTNYRANVISSGLQVAYDFFQRGRLGMYAFSQMGLFFAKAPVRGFNETMRYCPAVGFGVRLGSLKKYGLTYNFELAFTETSIDNDGFNFKPSYIWPLPQGGVYYVF